MMEVEDIHAYHDADMMPEDNAVDYGDHIMQDDHLVAIPEVEMENDVGDEAIEYDMEDAPGHADYAEDAAVPSISVHPASTAASSSPRLRTPPPADNLKADIVFESPSQARTPEPTVPTEEGQNTNKTSLTDPATTTPKEPEGSQPPAVESETVPAPPATQEVERSDALPETAEPLEPEESHGEEPHEMHEEPSNDLVPQPEDDSLPVPESPVHVGAEEDHTAPDEASQEYYPSPVFISSPNTSHPAFYLFLPPDSSPDELVYLADQPQLFFEPLHTVFEAIRGLADEVEIPEHVELAFYSEALDLNVSEVCQCLGCPSQNY